MAGLSLRPLKVQYGPAIVNGSYRAAQEKTWRVAVQTIEPESNCPTHADWMIQVQLCRAETTLRIADTESKQIHADIIPYKNGLK